MGNGSVANQTLDILMGLPFAGKTTLARALVARFGSTLIRIDSLNTARGLGRDGESLTPAQWGDTYRRAFNLLDAALGAGKTVVFDAVNFTVGQRDDVRARAAVYGVSAIVIYVTTPEAESRRRWQRNRETGERADVTDADFANVAEHFQPPTAMEKGLAYDGVEEMESWAQRNLDV